MEIHLGAEKGAWEEKVSGAAMMGGVPGDSAGGSGIKQLSNGFPGRTRGILSR